MMKKKYKVLIDLDRLKDPNNGLGQVALNYGNILGKTEDPDLKFTLLVPKNFVGYFGDKVEYEAITFKRRYFPALCPKYDLWHSIHQDCSYFPGDNTTPILLTINDLNFLGEKSKSKAARRLGILQKIVNRVQHITTISDYTAEVVKKNLEIGNIPIQTVYLGVEVPHIENPKRPAFVPDGKILFSVGVVREKKNYMTLIPFMKELPDEYCLVIAGNKDSDYADQIEAKVKELGLEKRVILPGLISDEDKCWIYANCDAVLFPSKFEGMGFPPIEAMRYEKPVFASTYSSIPEISGDNAYYWNDFEPAKMAEVFITKMKAFAADPQRGKIVKQHSMKYTWENCTREYIALYKKMLGVT
jgi:glycosyltransferase involved in cell wall biosynthesis